MNYLYIEEALPSLARRARRFLKRQSEFWQVILPRGFPAKKLAHFPDAKYFDSVIHDPVRHVFEAAARIFDGLQPFVAKKRFPREILDAVHRALLYPALPAAWSHVLRTQLAGTDRLVVISRRQCIHRAARSESEGTEIVTPAPLFIRLGSAAAVIWDGLRHALRCACEMLRPPTRKIKSPTVGVISGPNMPSDHVGHLFTAYRPEEIYFHVPGSVPGSSREMRAFKKKAESAGWNYWWYRDRHLARAVKRLLHYALRSVRLALEPARNEMDGLLLRVSVPLERGVQELGDMFHQTKLKLLVVACEKDPMGPLVAAMARRHTCKSVNLFSGNIHPSDPFVRPSDFDAWLLWSTSQERIFKRLGVPQQRIHVTGHLNDRAFLAMARRRALTRGEESIHLVYFSQYAVETDVDSRERISAILREVLEREPSARLSVKPHPLETDGLIESIWVGIPRASTVPRSVDSRELVTNAALVVAANSTTLLEALAVGVPVAVFDTTGQTSAYVRKGAAIDLLNSGSPADEVVAFCRNAARRAAMAEAARSIAEEFLGPLDGRSSERIAQVFEKLLVQNA